jgi:hypothetical protein
MSEESIICPVCQTENDTLSKACINCGQSLIVVCPRCNSVQAIAAGQCRVCGQRFDTLGYITARQEVRREDRFSRQAAGAIETKAEQQAHDQLRSRQLWERERQRQNMLADQLQRRKAQERKLMMGAAVAVIVVLMIVLINALAR